MTDTAQEEFMDETDETNNTHWWTESQIRNVIHTSEPGHQSPGEMFASRPSVQPTQTATVKDRESRGIWRSLVNWLRRR